jgi:flagellar biosynthetic protein FliP
MNNKRNTGMDVMKARLLRVSIAAMATGIGSAILAASPALAQQAVSLPKISLSLGSGGAPKDVANSLQVLFILTILSLAPSLLVMLTSFTRIVIILSFTRNAIGSPQVPPNSVMMGLALFLTFFTMAPVFKQVNDNALQPYLKQKISFDQAVTAGSEPIKGFMLRQTRTDDLKLFLKMSGTAKPKTKAELPIHVLIPAFLISELRTAFTIGFVIFIPFLVVDMVVSVILMSMGMMMLPPMMVSLPIKLLLFVLVDGWHLIAKSIALSFH